VLEEKDGAGTPKRVVRDLDLRVALGGGHQLVQQVSGAPGEAEKNEGRGDFAPPTLRSFPA